MHACSACICMYGSRRARFNTFVCTCQTRLQYAGDQGNHVVHNTAGKCPIRVFRQTTPHTTTRCIQDPNRVPCYVYFAWLTPRWIICTVRARFVGQACCMCDFTSIHRETYPCMMSSALIPPPHVTCFARHRLWSTDRGVRN